MTTNIQPTRTPDLTDPRAVAAFLRRRRSTTNIDPVRAAVAACARTGIPFCTADIADMVGVPAPHCSSRMRAAEDTGEAIRVRAVGADSDRPLWIGAGLPVPAGFVRATTGGAVEW